MQRTFIRAFLILTAAFLGATACDRTERVRLGAVLPLTGPLSIYGEESRRGLELAHDELRDAGVSRFEVTIVDSESDPGRARELTRELYRDGALAVIGGLTPLEAGGMAEVAEQLERVLLSPSATLDANARHCFSLAPTGRTAGTTMAGFAVRKLGVGNAVVVQGPGASSESLVEGFRSTFETQGGELLASVESVDEALHHQPDAVLLTGVEPGTSALVRELRRRAFPGEILTTQAFAVPASIRRLGDDAEGVLLTHTVYEPDGNEQAGSFAARYRRKYGDEPGIFAAESYDALRVLAAAVADRPPQPSEVRKGLLHDVRDFPGVTGPILFDERGRVARIPRVYSVGEDLRLRDHNQWLEDRKQDLILQLAALRQEMEATSP